MDAKIIPRPFKLPCIEINGQCFQRRWHPQHADGVNCKAQRWEPRYGEDGDVDPTLNLEPLGDLEQQMVTAVWKSLGGTLQVCRCAKCGGDDGR